MVWMRAAALRRFRKLWGRIDQDIPAGAQINVQIQNRCADLLRLFASGTGIICSIFVPAKAVHVTCRSYSTALGPKLSSKTFLIF